MAKEVDTSPSEEKTVLNVPEVDQFSSGTSENLVLSGYYDSDSYPTYRHRQKHPVNNQAKEVKKIKPKEKISPQKTEVSVSGSSSIDFHLRTFESGGRLVYSCDVCKRELSHLTSYRRHMKLHTMERPHKCPVCDKGFIRKYHCIDHVNKHHKGIVFDAETLNIVDSFKPENLDQSALSESLDGCQSEYNYTLDQSLESSDLEQSLNTSIDQSASNMLYNLAKSAAQDNQLNQSKGSIFRSNRASLRSAKSDAYKSKEDDEEEEEEENAEPGIDIEEGEELKNLRKRSRVIKVEPGIERAGPDDDNESNNVMSNSDDGNGISARKTEVTQGIKAIIAHLKKNKKKLASDSNGTPSQQIKVDVKSD